MGTTDESLFFPYRARSLPVSCSTDYLFTSHQKYFRRHSVASDLLEQSGHDILSQTAIIHVKENWAGQSRVPGICWHVHIYPHTHIHATQHTHSYTFLQLPWSDLDVLLKDTTMAICDSLFVDWWIRDKWDINHGDCMFPGPLIIRTVYLKTYILCTILRFWPGNPTFNWL